MRNRYLVHHGIKGQRWGIRRFQNADGTLTEEGKKRLRIEGQRMKENADELREWAEYDKDDADYYEEWLSSDPSLSQEEKQMFKDNIAGLRANYERQIQEAKAWEAKAEKFLKTTSLDDFSEDELDFFERQCESYLEQKFGTGEEPLNDKELEEILKNKW